jgi:hypothetical protein
LLIILISSCITFEALVPNPAPSAVTPSVIGAFSVNPSTINSGGTSTLEWNVTGADTVRIDPNIGYVPLSGSETVSPDSTTTYILTATSASGVIQHITEIVVPLKLKPLDK